MLKRKDVGITILFLVLLIELEHLVLDFGVRALHQRHELLIRVNIQLFPFTQWFRRIEICAEFLLHLLPQLVRNVFASYVLSVYLYLVRICYTCKVIIYSNDLPKAKY